MAGKQSVVEGLERRQLLSAVPTPAHVVVVMIENKSFADLIGNPSAAYINSLAAGGALFTNSHAVTHPSQPNYIALFSGDTHGVADDDGPLSFAGPDLYSELAAAGRTFTGYSEQLPAAGSTVLVYQDYARKHNPWSDFTDVPASVNQPDSAFPTNFATLPTVSVVIPDLDDDMHDGTIAEGDAWIQTNLGAYATWAKANNSLLVLTCDEDDDTDTINQVPTIFYGQNVVTGTYGEYVNHYSILRTIEDMYGTGYAGASATATPITDVWAPSAAPTPTPTPAQTYVSNLTPTTATTGYGTIHYDSDINGTPITLRGTVYAKGIGTHAASAISYALNGGYTTFASDVGVDDDVIAKGGTGSVDFTVIGDGKTLYDSGKLSATSPVARVSVGVAGVKTLQLVATNGIAGNIDYDHADWAGAVLTAATVTTPTAPTAATGLTAVATGSNAVSLSWTNTATNQTGCEVDRSLDGITFASIATLAAGASSYGDTGLTGGTRYSYRVLATNAVGKSPASNIATATTLAAGAVQTYVSDLTYTSATTGYGTVRKDASINGNPIKLRGTTYAKGLGTHAASTITYDLAGAYTTFLADVGIDDETTGQGLVDFKVVADGVTLYDSGNLTGSAPVGHVNVSVAGAKTLQLVATNGVAGSIDFDHADWANARLLAAAVPPAAPSSLVAAAVSATEVDLTWASNSVNQAGFEVDRSTDGVTFAKLATTTATSYADKTAVVGAKNYYRVLAYNATGSSAASNVASATTFAAAPVTTSLSSLAWTSATTGYGAAQKNLSINTNPITLHGVVYAKGIGTHAASTITYALGGQFASFLSDVGIDDEVKESGSVDFQVVGDGVTLFDSGVLTSASPTVSINVSVAGVKTLQLIATNGIAGVIDYDHADWANARLLSTAAPIVPAAPTGVAVAVVSRSALTVTWKAVDATVINYEVQRSTDGTTYAAVATVGPNVLTYANTGLTANKKYYYRLVAINAVGRSVVSSAVSATTLAK